MDCCRSEEPKNDVAVLRRLSYFFFSAQTVLFSSGAIENVKRGQPLCELHRRRDSVPYCSLCNGLTLALSWLIYTPTS